jgi:hypothetical protein
MKCNVSLSLDVNLAKKTKEISEILGMTMTRFVSFALIDMVEKYEKMTDEEKKTALEVRWGRPALDADEFVRRKVERMEAMKKMPAAGKTIEEMEEGNEE